MQGTFDDFPADVVLTVLAGSGRTGALRFEGPSAGAVYLLDGLLVHAETEHGIPVGRLVQARGLASAEEWDAAVADGGDVLSRLTARGADETLLIGALRDHIADVLFQQLLAQDGGFRFEAGIAHPAASEIGVPAAETVDVTRAQLSRWEELRGVLGTLDAPLALGPGTGDEVVLDPAEWQLVCTVDGSRGIRQLTTEIAAPLIEVAERAATLVQRGLLRLA